MSYDKQLADRVREALEHLQDVEEKEMFSGVCFMVNRKMCVCVSHENLLYRIGSEAMEEAAERPGCRQAVMQGRAMKDYALVTPDGLAAGKDFEHWIRLCLDFNPKAKSSKGKRSS
jgi:TfoX/Sxy family transcriptional regulator of competence genes